MRLTKQKVPRPAPPLEFFALVPKKCRPLWGGCGETVWLERMDGVLFVTALGESIYVPICKRCADTMGEKT